jgi:hypothetical protein
MVRWKEIALVAVAMTIIAEAVHTLESILTLGYYMDPAYFGVWSKLMMPAAGPPPAQFHIYSIVFAFVSWVIFGFVYDKLGGGLKRKSSMMNGFEFGIIIFLVAGIPTVLTMYLLINLPSGLLAVWTFVQLVLYLVGGLLSGRLIKPV